VNEGSDQEPSTAVEAEDAVTCVAATVRNLQVSATMSLTIRIQDDYWFSGSEDTEVRRYLRESNEFDAPLTSVAGVPVRSVAIDPKGRRVAVSSECVLVLTESDIELKTNVSLSANFLYGW
jgi:chromosome transmission fidelity protein 4